MLLLYKKKIVKLLSFFPKFFERYLPHIVFMVFALQLLIAIGSLPYFNIIGKYYFYVSALLWIIGNILFKRYITNRRILISGITALLVAIPFSIIQIENIADIVGFAAYLFFLTYLVRQVVIDKKDLES